MHVQIQEEKWKNRENKQCMDEWNVWTKNEQKKKWLLRAEERLGYELANADAHSHVKTMHAHAHAHAGVVYVYVYVRVRE